MNGSCFCLPVLHTKFSQTRHCVRGFGCLGWLLNKRAQAIFPFLASRNTKLSSSCSPIHSELALTHLSSQSIFPTHSWTAAPRYHQQRAEGCVCRCSAFCILFNWLHSRLVYDSHFPLARYMWLVTGSLALFAVLGPVCQSTFCHPFYPDVSHMREDSRPSPAFLYCKWWKAGCSLGTKLEYCTVMHLPVGTFGGGYSHANNILF